MVDWLVDTLRAYSQLAAVVALAIGFVIGPLESAGCKLGNTAPTLLGACRVDGSGGPTGLVPDAVPPP